MTIIEAVELSKQSTFKQMIKQAPPGLFMEFGVYQGNSIKIIAENTNFIVYGFDSFEGLPENWYIHNKGHFSCEIPSDLPDNVKLIPGWFEDTLPNFISNTTESIAFIHIDCDLYSSTKCVFDNLKNNFQNGSIIVFDELYGYTGWENHEYKAFEEFLKETKFSWECIGKYNLHQAGFKLYV